MSPPVGGGVTGNRESQDGVGKGKNPIGPVLLRHPPMESWMARDEE